MISPRLVVQLIIIFSLLYIFSYILVIVIQNVRKSKNKKYPADENLNIISHFLVVGASVLSLYALLVILYEIIVNRIG